jgi:hypothetical protein
MTERRIHELEQIQIMLARQMQARGSRQRLQEVQQGNNRYLMEERRHVQQLRQEVEQLQRAREHDGHDRHEKPASEMESNRRKERIQQNLIFTNLDQEASIIDIEAHRSKSLEKNATDETNVAKPECMICLSPYEMGETIAWAKAEECVHVFHKECIMEWLLKDHDDCPLCRTNILFLDPTNNEKIEVVVGGEEAV